MAAQDPLSELRDIHLPADVGLWPPAPGWWLLAALLVALGVYGGRKLLAGYRLGRRRQAALSALDAAYQQFQQDNAGQEQQPRAAVDFLNDANSILRRVALERFGDAAPVSSSGPRWLQFLDSRDEGQAFREGEGQVLGDAVYRKEFRGDVEPVYRLAREWIAKRYRQAAPGRRAGPREEAA